jgi:hypothetical protein
LARQTGIDFGQDDPGGAKMLLPFDVDFADDAVGLTQVPVGLPLHVFL